MPNGCKDNAVGNITLSKYPLEEYLPVSMPNLEGEHTGEQA